nr:MAG TPA: hypothetical protein [Caudoviricetes sp.]
MVLYILGLRVNKNNKTIVIYLNFINFYTYFPLKLIKIFYKLINFYLK